MAAEPINLFAHKIDPRGVLNLLRHLAPACQVSGPDENWQDVIIQSKKSWFSKAVSLSILHDADYYDGADWPMQRSGMQGYFSRFPDGPQKQDVLRLIGTFRFSLATSFDPDLDFDHRDSRLDILLAIAKHLDGCFFSPSSLRDSAGRILLDASGYSDPQAVFPASLKLSEAVVSIPSDKEDNDENEEPAPPTAQRVAQRMLALAVVANRGLVENEAGAKPEVREAPAQMIKYVNNIGIGDELEPDEWEALRRPLGRLEPQTMIDCVWRIEGLNVLTWALNLTEMQAHDELVRPPEVFEAIHLFNREFAAELLGRPQLRSPEELHAMQGRLLGIHWRLRNFTLRPEPMDFNAFSKKCWFGSFDISGIRTLNNDLAIGDSPISEASEDEFDTAFSAARERHQAINWLNWGGVYSEVDTST
jgi:hypothetical protein